MVMLQIRVCVPGSRRKSASFTGTGKDLLFSKLSRDLATVLWIFGHASSMAFSLCLFTAVNAEQTNLVLGLFNSHHLHR